MGSVPPARCFYTRRAFADRDLPSRPKPDGGPPHAFAPVQRSIATVPHRPADRSRHVGRCFLPWAFLAVRHMTGRRTRASRGFRPRCVPRPGFGYPPRGVHHHPSRRLAAPERPSASPFKAFTPRRSGLLSEPPALVALLASIRLAPLGSVRTRSTSGLRSRRGFVLATAPLRARRVDAFLGFSLQSALPLRPGARLWFAGPPLSRAAGLRHDPPASQGLAERRDRLAPLGATGSRGVLHLATVAGSFRPDRGAGSWICLTARPPRAVRADPSPVVSGPAGAEAPTRAPPSLGRDFCNNHQFGPPRRINFASPWPWVDHSGFVK
jgi:hypothetical protein